MQTVTYIAPSCLPCGECGGSVVLCIDVDTACGVPYVNATIDNVQHGVNNCGAAEYTYDFSYNEYDLADPLTPLVTADINGVFCRGCITDYIDSAFGAAAAAAFGNFCLVLSESQLVTALADPDCTHILVAAGFTLTDDRTLPVGKSLTSANGAPIATSGHILTVNGNISSGAYPIFTTSTSQVVFNRNTNLPVEWFGALGDGSTDDSTAIQLAIDVAIAANGGTIKLHPGKTYVVESELVIDSSAVDLTISGYGATIKGNANANILRISDVSASDNPVNIVCKGFSIEGSLLDNPGYTSQDGIYIYSIDGLVLQDIKITNIAGDGIVGRKCTTGSPNVWKQVKWDHVVVEDCGSRCAYIFNPASDPCDELTITDCRFSGAGQLLAAPGTAAGGGTDLEVMTFCIHGSEFSENYSQSIAAAYKYGLAIRNACGTMLANVFRNNCKNLADTADLLLNSDVQGIVVQSQSHFGNSLNAAQDAIYVLGAGCVLNVIRYESGNTREYRRIVNSLDGSDVKLLHVGPIINNSEDYWLGVSVTDTEVAYVGDEGRESLIMHDGILRSQRRREDLNDRARRFDFTLTDWGAGASVNGGSSARFDACDSHGVVDITGGGAGAANPCRVQYDYQSAVDWPNPPTVLVQLIATDDAAVVDVAVPIRVVSSTTNFYFDVYMLPAVGSIYTFSYQVVAVGI